MSEAAWTTSGIIAASVLTLLGTIVIRRSSRRVDDAQAEKTEAEVDRTAAETFEIAMRGIRAELVAIQNRAAELVVKLDMEVRNRRALNAHVDILEQHINDRKPPPPPTRPVLEF